MVPRHLKTVWFLVCILPDGLVAHLVSECDLEWPTHQGSQCRSLKASIYQSMWPWPQPKIYLGHPLSWLTWEHGLAKCFSRIF